MALDGSFNGLCASVADTLNRADLTAVIPDWVALAEAQMNRKLRTRRQVATTALTTSTGFVALPADCVGPITITLADGTALESMSPEGIAEQAQTEGTFNNGTPTAYAVVGTQLQFDPAFTASATVSLTYYQKIPPFATAPNWVSQNHIDAYLYGALVQSAPYLQDDARIPIWATLFTTALNDIKSLDKKESYGAQLTPHTLLVV